MGDWADDLADDIEAFSRGNDDVRHALTAAALRNERAFGETLGRIDGLSSFGAGAPGADALPAGSEALSSCGYDVSARTNDKEGHTPLTADEMEPRPVEGDSHRSDRPVGGIFTGHRSLT